MKLQQAKTQKASMPNCGNSLIVQDPKESTATFIRFVFLMLKVRVNLAATIQKGDV